VFAFFTEANKKNAPRESRGNMEAPSPAVREDAFVVISKRDPVSEERARSQGAVQFDLGSYRNIQVPKKKPLERVAEKLAEGINADSVYHKRFMMGVFKRVMAVYEKATELLPATQSELSDILHLWAKNEGRDINESFDATFAAWQINGYKDSTQGKLIIRLNERKSALVEVVR
jgi:hypothetical protein